LTISKPSFKPSAKKPRDFNLKREQNPHFRLDNGLTWRNRLTPPLDINAYFDAPVARAPMAVVVDELRAVHALARSEPNVPARSS
jgi:hypothetical protein